MAAINAIREATAEAEVNVIGYCIGGTCLRAPSPTWPPRKTRRVAAATFFTTLLDFSDVGDISVFIDEDQLKMPNRA